MFLMQIQIQIQRLCSRSSGVDHEIDSAPQRTGFCCSTIF